MEGEHKSHDSSVRCVECEEAEDRALLDAARVAQWRYLVRERRLLQHYQESESSNPKKSENHRRCEESVARFTLLLGDYEPPPGTPERAPLNLEAIEPTHEVAKRGRTWCESPAEERLLIELSKHDVDFEQQFRIGKHRVDFAFAQQRLVVEVDGFDYHDRTPELAERDKRRDRELMTLGWSVARFSGREVATSVDQCAQDILAILRVRS